jgi:hypothetical protein
VDITRVIQGENSSEYLLHNQNPAFTEQYKLWGNQGAVDRRISKIRHANTKRDFVVRCQAQAKFRKEETKAKAIKVIVLFLMTDPPKFSGKSKLIATIKKFGDSKGIKVSEARFRDLYYLYSGLLAK